LSVTDHCLKSRDYINVIIAGKQPELQFLDMDAAIAHCKIGVSKWDWASTDNDGEPDVVMACAGDVPTLEALAAADFLNQHVPELKLRFINVVDLMALQCGGDHPHALDIEAFNTLFTQDKPVIFNFHGYPSVIHQLIYKCANQPNFHVHGFKEEGTTTTPFDMAVMNEIDRFNLAKDVIRRVPGLAENYTGVLEILDAKLREHHAYIRQRGEDMPDIRNWTFPKRT
jgi:xylulose-5-phosphate/fructose-6-phosphate phosphoketolase